MQTQIQSPFRCVCLCRSFLSRLFHISVHDVHWLYFHEFRATKKNKQPNPKKNANARPSIRIWLHCRPSVAYALTVCAPLHIFSFRFVAVPIVSRKCYFHKTHSHSIAIVCSSVFFFVDTFCSVLFTINLYPDPKPRDTTHTQTHSFTANDL